MLTVHVESSDCDCPWNDCPEDHGCPESDYSWDGCPDSNYSDTDYPQKTSIQRLPISLTDLTGGETTDFILKL